MTDRLLKGAYFADTLIRMPDVLRYSSTICMHDVRLILLSQTIGATWHQGYELVGMPAQVDNVKLGRYELRAMTSQVIGLELDVWSAREE